MSVLEFNFDFVSPMSYFALVQLEGIKQRTGCEVSYVPVFLGGIMQATGNSPPGKIPAKSAYMMKDMNRLANKLGVPFVFNPAFPMNTLPLLRMLASLSEEIERLRFINTVFHHVWIDPKNVADNNVRDQVLSEAGFDVASLNQQAELDANKDIIKQNTERAIARGAFGAPTFFVGENMYFGQDRLHLVEDALTGKVWA